MIYDDLKKANVQAMKDKDVVARSIYSVLLNKFMLEVIRKREKGEELTDGDASNILQKTIKELTEEKENYAKVGNAEEVLRAQKQIEIVEKYLPKMLSREEIAKIIAGLDDKSVPNVMKFFKASYNGQCDMKVVQDVLRQGK